MAFAETFLAYPELFPARSAGEPWGDRQVSIDFIGGPYLFTGLESEQEQAVRERFGELCGVSENSTDSVVETRVFRAVPEDFREFDLRGWKYSFDTEHHPDSVRIAGLHVMATVDWSPAVEGSLWVLKGASLISSLVFENYFRILVAYRLLQMGGVLLHSAAVADESGVYLFLGPSGAGKSTISRLSLEAGRAVLSDDMNALRPRDAEVVVEKLPFAGDYGQTSTPSGLFPLRALSFLKQGRCNVTAAMSPAQAVAALATCSPYVNIDPYRSDILFDNLSALSSRISAQVLTFSLDGQFWEVLKPQQREVL